MFSLPAKSVVKNVGRRYYRKTTKAVLLDKKKPRIPVTPIPEVIEQNAEKRVSYSPSSSKQNVLTIKKASAKEESLTVNLPDVPHKFLTAEKNNISFNRRGKNFPVVAFSPGMMGICKQLKTPGSTMCAQSRGVTYASRVSLKSSIFNF
ncbi:uncharacterized protein LOC105693357 isoform X2 [Athalia rosae]|uniref:uncharacterized protein LOC105693357 isoform X2 n=1 Tax=Athalia rosae TaxID=37344 RepID=UPI0020335EE8|nr:uncharacterized protein LOC105693357 isoform X2 [Athalia rosae]